MKYLKKFKTNADYIIFKNSDKYITPNVSLIEGTDEVHYQVNIPPVAVLFEGMISNRKIKVNERDLITPGVFSLSDLPDLSDFINVETQSVEPIKVTFKYVTEIGESVLNSETGNQLPLILNFGPNVTSIGEYAFANSGIVTDIVFDKNSNLTTIGEGAFKNCMFNTETITTTDGHEFLGMARLLLPDGITTIGDEAFNGVYNSDSTYNNTLEVNLPPTVVSIGDRVFEDSGFSYFNIPNSITTIPNSTFSGCMSSEMAIIGFHKVTGAGGLEITIGGQTLIQRDLPPIGILISDEITSIGDFAFASFCSDYYFGYQGGQIEEIGDGILIAMGNGITSIGEGAFTSVPSTQVICFAETPPALAENDDPFPDFSDKGIDRILAILVPENSVDAYKTAWPHLADYIVANR